MKSMDLQEEQDSNGHGSGRMLVICKHWNWNWHWDWKYFIFLTKGDDIVWVTASTKLCDLLITWSHDKCKTLYLPSTIPMAPKIGRVVTYGGGTPFSKSHDLLIMRSHDKWKKYISALPQYLWLSNLAEW